MHHPPGLQGYNITSEDTNVTVYITTITLASKTNDFTLYNNTLNVLSLKCICFTDNLSVN